MTENASARPTFVIAEAGVNHNGDMGLARTLIDIAADAGANAVKFQSFRADSVVTALAPKAAYQLNETDAVESQLDMLRKYELSPSDHHMLSEHAASKGIEFMSTAFDTENLDLLADDLCVQRLKLPSGEITNGPLVLAHARKHRDIIVSTGMSDLDEIQTALDLIAFGMLSDDEIGSLEEVRDLASTPAAKDVLRDKVSLLHCVSQYPAPYADMNLFAISTLRQCFGLPIGLSDHSIGIEMSVAAVALGANIIEKHFTADRTLPGPDHKASITPQELTQMISSIRHVEAGFGDGRKKLMESEADVRDMARRSIVAKTVIKKGEPFSNDNLDILRPGTGLSPLNIWQLLGTPSKRGYSPGDLIDHGEIDA